MPYGSQFGLAATLGVALTTVDTAFARVASAEVELNSGTLNARGTFDVGNLTMIPSGVAGWRTTATTAVDTTLARNAAGVVEINNGTAGQYRDMRSRSVIYNPVTVATLPAGQTGAVASVSDGAASLAWGATVTGGGSTKYLVWHNGTNWTVIGK